MKHKFLRTFWHDRKEFYSLLPSYRSILYISNSFLTISIGEYISNQGRYVGDFSNGKFNGHGTMHVKEGKFEGKISRYSYAISITKLVHIMFILRLWYEYFLLYIFWSSAVAVQ